MNSYRYHIESKQPTDIPYRCMARYIDSGKITGETLADAQAKIINKRSRINEEIVMLNLEKMDNPVRCKGKVVFSFDYDFTARDKKEVDEIINHIFDHWYDGQDDELYDALACDIGQEVAMDTEFNVSNATVVIEEV